MTPWLKALYTMVASMVLMWSVAADAFPVRWTFSVQSGSYYGGSFVYDQDTGQFSEVYVTSFPGPGGNSLCCYGPPGGGVLSGGAVYTGVYKSFNEDGAVGGVTFVGAPLGTTGITSYLDLAIFYPYLGDECTVDGEPCGGPTGYWAEVGATNTAELACYSDESPFLPGEFGCNGSEDFLGFRDTTDDGYRMIGAPVPTAAEDGPISVTEGVATVIHVGANDSGFSTPVTVSVITPPLEGTIAAISAPGPAAEMRITYTANVGAVGHDSFVYQIVDSASTSDSATVTINISSDTDGDSIPDGSDNCTLVANALPGNVPGTSIPKHQLDSDDDGYGNACDADFNNSGRTTATDYAMLRSVLNELASYNPLSAASDLNGSGTVTATDYAILRARINTPPGPSGHACAGTTPCPQP